jgi:hypothetical protein
LARFSDLARQMLLESPDAKQMALQVLWAYLASQFVTTDDRGEIKKDEESGMFGWFMG